MQIKHNSFCFDVHILSTWTSSEAVNFSPIISIVVTKK